MGGWRLPLAAVAFGLGLLAAPRAPGPVWGWLGAGLVGSVGAVALARGPAEDRLAAAGFREAGLAGRTRAALPGRAAGRPHVPPPVVPLVLGLALLALGLGWGGLHRTRTAGALLATLAPARVEVEGELRVDPRPWTRGWSAILDARSVRAGDRAWVVRETLWVSGYGEPPSAVRGDRVRVAGALRVPDDAGFAESLLRRGIAAQLSVAELERLGPSANPVIRAAQAVRGVVGARIRALFPPREAGLLLGLALGDDSGLDEGIERDFRATGLGHLLVVSGGNVAMVLAPVLALALALRLGRWWRFALGLSTVAFFVVLTGAEPSVMRAGVMAGLALAGGLLGRPRSAGSVLAGAVLALLVLDPALVWSVGFQLSVGATASMVAMATPIAERLRFLPRPAALATGATVAAQVGVAPLLLAVFHEVPLVTVLANVLAFPAVSPALLLGLAAAGLGLVSPTLARAVALVAQLPLRYLEAVADRMSTAPVPWITSGGGAAILPVGLALVVGLALWLRSGRRLGRGWLALALALPLVVWSSALGAGPPAGLTVRFFDVGQGDAALVTSPRGATVLVDAGPDATQVATALVALGVKRVDLAVATHPHADHVAGFPDVFARLPVGLVIEPGCDEPSPAYDAFLRAVREEGLPVRHPRAGELLTVGDLRVEVLAPTACFEGTDSDPNNDSLVLRISLGEDAVLFPGDAEEPSQEAMLAAGAPIAADVLKVPHHGGATSLEAFLTGVGAEVAVVSIGQPNDYGHPVPSVLATLRHAGATVLRTDRLGDVVVSFSPEGLLVASEP
ncbi:ComE operon protein 3 [bacterium HR12]|nr:ComE operon protein 3 [bacterium HR12]